MSWVCTARATEEWSPAEISTRVEPMRGAAALQRLPFLTSPCAVQDGVVMLRSESSNSVSLVVLLNSPPAMTILPVVGRAVAVWKERAMVMFGPATNEEFAGA